MEGKYHNLLIGQWGEDLALCFLKKRGYELVERNVKTSYKELDLVMRQGGSLVFVEVKTRLGDRLGTAVEALTDRKLANLRQAALFYLGRSRQPRAAAIRFDFVAIDVDRAAGRAKVRHFRDIG